MSALGLNIATLAGPGRPVVPVNAEYLRDLTEADIALMALQPLGSQPPGLKRVTDRHHMLARLLAGGMPEGEAAIVTGYDVSRISILKNSPAFEELLALYRAEAHREFASALEHMGGLARDAILELRDRLEENGERFSNNELIKMATELTDRTEGREEAKVRPEIIELVAPEARVAESID